MQVQASYHAQNNLFSCERYMYNMSSKVLYSSTQQYESKKLLIAIFQNIYQFHGSRVFCSKHNYYLVNINVYMTMDVH